MSRGTTRSRQLRRRSSRTVPATIVAVVLLAAAALAVLLAVARLVNGAWPRQAVDSATALAALTWGSSAVIGAGAAIALIGLVLLVAGLMPGAFTNAQLQPATVSAVDFETDFVISTRAMARIAAARADAVDGVDRVSAAASGRRVSVRVTTTSEQAAEIRDQVSQHVSDALSAAGLHPAPKVSVTVHTKGI
ncbi:MAG: DUF6286 domain-containing protein [Propionibacteriaceae bacterium]